MTASLSVHSAFPVPAFHSSIVPSSDADARSLPCGEKARPPAEDRSSDVSHAWQQAVRRLEYLAAREILLPKLPRPRFN